MKIALLCSGQARGYRYVLENMMKNFIQPNSLDVFMLIDSSSVLKEGKCPFYKYDESISDQEYIEKVIGPHLKVLKIFDCSKDETYNIQSRYFVNRVKQNIKNGSLEGNIPYVKEYASGQIHQYYKQLLLTEVFEHWCCENSSNYDYVIKFRPDRINIKKPINIHKYLKDADIYVPGMVFDGISIIYMQENYFICKPQHYRLILKELLESYGSYRYNYLTPDLNKICVPEYNFAQTVTKYASTFGCKISPLFRAISGKGWDLLTDCENKECEWCMYYEFKL